ncbi:patatin-like phospholipase family protein [Tellurirhabdus bombi]|uniref:patatin-like phospholipase family protein n=1 Tax=Tellurirhabdus bombi TaxID=2907205 RepID=UPI001F1B9F92|nr:patatin-like phospholipase family protein [Tellurirhabdus bombi]
MKTKNKNILSLDAGGVKGVYSLHIISYIEKELNISFSKHFDFLIGTSIGAVIATNLAYGLSVTEMLNHFKGIKENAHQGQSSLMTFLFEYIDYIYGTEKISAVSKKVFLPIYNSSEKRITSFGINSNTDDNIKIADVLKASCSDIRITQPYNINELKATFVDAGFFAYDPTLFFLRKNIDLLNKHTNCLSIGSGLIENFSNDLNMGYPFDLVYDAIIYEQFEENTFIFNYLVENKKISYLRVSEFPSSYINPLSIDDIIELALKKANSIDRAKLNYFFK